MDHDSNTAAVTTRTSLVRVESGSDEQLAVNAVLVKCRQKYDRGAGSMDLCRRSSTVIDQTTLAIDQLKERVAEILRQDDCPISDLVLILDEDPQTVKLILNALIYEGRVTVDKGYVYSARH